MTAVTTDPDGRDFPDSVEQRDGVEDLYQNAPCGLLSTLPDGTIANVNHTFLAWTGYEREDVIGRRRFQDLLSVGGRIYHETHYGPLLRMQGAVREIALEIVCRDGARLPVLINSTLHADDSGAPATIRTAVFSAGDRRSYEEELLRARELAEASESRAHVLAQTLQESFIPPTPPAVPGLDVGAVYRPAGDGGQVGGDFYDVFETTGGDWGVVLGDVCGKGAHAATVTTLARYTVRAVAMQTSQPAEVLGALNAALLRHETERFCTVVYARLTRGERGAQRLTIASGGHPLPLRVTSAGDIASVGRPGDLIGVLTAPALHDSTDELAPGDIVAFYSDGVTEARAGDAFYGDERLQHRLASSRHGTAQEIVEAVLADVMAFQGDIARDDIALVVLKVPEAPRDQAASSAARPR